MFISLPVRRKGLRSERSNTYNLTIPKVKREAFAARAFSVKGPLLWNQLPNTKKTIEDFKSFKKQLKTFYLKKTAYINNKYYLTLLCKQQTIFIYFKWCTFMESAVETL